MSKINDALNAVKKENDQPIDQTQPQPLDASAPFHLIRTGGLIQVVERINLAPKTLPEYQQILMILQQSVLPMADKENDG